MPVFQYQILSTINFQITHINLNFSRFLFNYNNLHHNCTRNGIVNRNIRSEKNMTDVMLSILHLLTNNIQVDRVTYWWSRRNLAFIDSRILALRISNPEGPLLSVWSM